MPQLTIDEKNYDLKCNIQFARVAKEWFEEKKKKGDDEQDGFFNLYMQLMNRDAESVIPFWKAALAHHKELQKRTDLESVLEILLEERTEADDDSEPVIKECFEMLDQAGFFKGKRKTFWNRMDRQKKKFKKVPAEETEDQKKKRLEQLDEIEELEAAYNDIKEA